METGTDKTAEVFIFPLRPLDGIYLADTKDRLREGPFATMTEAENVLEQLAKTGLDCLRVVLVGKVRA